VLVAHVVAPGASAADLRARIARRLPPSMVPHEIRLVDRIPRLVSGKVDRRAMERPRPSADAGGAADGDPVRVLADAWCEVLNRPAPPEGDFFALGGDSLSAAKLIVRVAEGLGVELPMEAVLDHPEFDAMAGYLRDAVTARNHVVPPTHS
jgi:L-serine---[L-seryl-carrier protein] ligase